MTNSKNWLAKIDIEKFMSHCEPIIFHQLAQKLIKYMILSVFIEDERWKDFPFTHFMKATQKNAKQKAIESTDNASLMKTFPKTCHHCFIKEIRKLFSPSTWCKQHL